MERALDIDIRPSRHRVLERVDELTRSDHGLRDRLQAVKSFSARVRSAEVFITNACNLRCKGCWFFEHDLDKAAEEVRDPEELRRFARQLRSDGTTNVLLIGGEPALVPDRIAVFTETFPYVSVVSNGTRPVPYKGFENVQVFVSLWGGGPIDDELRGRRPNGRRVTGLFDLGLRTYQHDPRVVWVYTVSEPGLPHLEPTVRAIRDNGNQVVFGFYSDYGTDDPTGLQEGDLLINEMNRVWEAYRETVIGHPYYFDALVRGRSHWGAFGYDTCPSISVSHEAHAERLANGNPVLRGFNTYRADHTVQFCCTSGNCGGCRDSQAMWSWMLVNMHRFLEDTEQLRTWVEMAENFYRQYYWSPYRLTAHRTQAEAVADAE
ncbi:radical SAM protein [Streptomyces sp. TRM 70351]|uniref:radical SAM protein n=1 Tax=Streptomyces sp. TRM 70351 TaxID=3116552 RepID=UPI002E7BCCE8|nr:radical SAM protein [Streptomyces sp. TRM 70351]MEE1928868.1 radical SAM protein [Streptomyces sp. TRM 70351]